MSDMNVTAANAYSAYQAVSGVAPEETKVAAKEEEKDSVKTTEESGVVYEKSESVKPATYSINKMSSEDRANLVKQLKEEQEARQQQLVDIVMKMLGDQASAYQKAGGSVWDILSSGEFTVDEATKEQAKKDIDEDGYFGVKQTAQRMFDFASALAGDDVDQMHKMQKALEKGYKEAEKIWGKELPEICKNTLDAANKLFEDYYNSKNSDAAPVEITE